ncbi:MAG: hypothetical protein AAF526_03055 [Pseudomonadota bacterium]
METSAEIRTILSVTATIDDVWPWLWCPARLRLATGSGILALVIGGTLQAQEKPRFVEDWEFVVAPYLLLPSIDGTTSIGRVGGDISVDPGGVFSTLQFGGMVHAEARHRSGFGIMLDTAFMFLGDGASGERGIGSVDANVFQGIFEVYATYRIDLDDTKLDGYAGPRIWHIDTDIDVQAGPLAGSFDGGDTWVDPVIGARLQHRIAPSWRLQSQGDVGGFGIAGASDFSWNIMAGVAYDGWASTSLFLMYRALSVDFDSGTRGTPAFFEYDTITHGPLFGIGYRF